MNTLHQEILRQIKLHSGKPTKHTFLNKYLGNSHPIYPISVPVLRKIARNWMSAHRDLSAAQFAAVLTSLIKGKSSTEKCIAGILLDYSTVEQRKFNPALFNTWLSHLEGWAEVDTLCTGRYSDTELAAQWSKWKPLLDKFSKSRQIEKRRASLVMFCSPLRKMADERMARKALETVIKLSSEKEVLITKAISWVLRSMVKTHRPMLEEFIAQHELVLPKIALRETVNKLSTGNKSRKK